MMYLYYICSWVKKTDLAIFLCFRHGKIFFCFPSNLTLKWSLNQHQVSQIDTGQGRCTYFVPEISCAGCVPKKCCQIQFFISYILYINIIYINFMHITFIISSTSTSINIIYITHTHIIYTYLHNIYTTLFPQEFLHRSFYTGVYAGVVIPEFLYRSYCTGVLTQKFLLHRSCTQELFLRSSYREVVTQEFFCMSCYKELSHMLRHLLVSELLRRRCIRRANVRLNANLTSSVGTFRGDRRACRTRKRAVKCKFSGGVATLCRDRALRTRERVVTCEFRLRWRRLFTQNQGGMSKLV